MATLGSLVVSLECQMGKFEQGMNRAEYLAKKTGDSIVSSLKVIGVAAAGMFSLSKMDAAITRITTMESNLVKAAARLNTTAETLSSFSIIARKAGMDNDAFIMTLTRIEKGMSAAASTTEQATGKYDENGEEILKTSKTYDELGINVQELIKLPLDQQLQAIAKSMKENIAPADRVRVAMELGGKGAAGMVAPLMEGGEALQKMTERAKELIPMTDQMAKTGAAVKSAGSDMTLAWDGFAAVLVDKVGPAITYTLSKLTDLIVEARKAQSINMVDVVKQIHQGGVAGAGGTEGLTGGGGGGGWGGEVFKAPVRPTGKTGGGGGKSGGGDMGLDRMSTIIDTLTKDLAKLTQGSLAEITAWGAHMRNEITKVGAKGAETSVAMALVDKTETAKKLKATEDYNLFVAKASGDTYKEIEGQAKADLEKYKGFASAKSVTDAATARKKIEQTAKNNEEVWGLQKNIFDSLSSLTPIISEQNFLKKKSLDLEILIGKSTLDRKLAELELSKAISKAQADEFRGMQAIEAQAKRTNLAMEQDKGIKGWAAQRVKSESQTNTWADAMGGLESYVNDAWTQGVQGALSKTKVDYMEVAKTMAVSFMLNLGKQGIHKTFNTVAEAIAGGGIGKLGTDANPMVVTIKGMNIKGLGGGAGADFEQTAKKAGNVSYSMGGSKGGQDDFAFTDQYFKNLQKSETKFDRVFTNDLKDWNNQFKILTKTGDTYSDLQGDWAKDNQEAFKTEYLGQYQTDFTGMVGGITSVWSVGQGLMTAAGVSGDVQRIASMASFGLQGISLLSNFANSAVLIDAKKAAAAAYAWVIEMVPPPANFPLAVVAAGLAFAGTMAVGKSSAGGDFNVDMMGPRILHPEETVLPAWAAKSWRDIVSRGAMPGGGPGGNGGGETHVHYHDNRVVNAIDARGVEKVLEKHGRAMVRIIDRQIGTRGRKL